MRAARFLRAAAAGLVMFPGIRAAEPPADDDVRAAVDRRVAAWWPKPEEKRFDRIGWAADIRTALDLAARLGRPVFLFTMDGRVNLGRC